MASRYAWVNCASTAADDNHPDAARDDVQWPEIGSSRHRARAAGRAGAEGEGYGKPVRCPW